MRDESLAAWARDVVVCSTENLMAMLTAGPQVLSPDDVRRCAEAVRTGAVRRADIPAAKRARSTSRKPSRTGVALVGALVLLAAIWSGGLQKAGERVGEQFVGTITPNTPPAETEPVKRTQKNRKRQQGGRQQAR